MSAAAQIKADWVVFFSGTAPAAKKIAQLQNGQKYAALIRARAASGLARSVSAKVLVVHVKSPAQATVTYDILIGGKPVLRNQVGTAINQNGTWKVGDASFCRLLALENKGKVPPACGPSG
jgi:hypothetical protein